MNTETKKPRDHFFNLRNEIVPMILDGSKTIEVRVGDIVFLSVNPGDSITFNKIPETKRIVSKVNNYQTFKELLAIEDPQAILPGYEPEVIHQLLRSFYTPTREKQGVLAFHLQNPV